jgi:ATP-dependent helicase/nuclease subunit A
MKDMIALEARRDMLGEELRVLYVALTRAKDKCILSAGVADWGEELSRVPATCNYSSLFSARRFLDWILLALAHHSVLTQEFQRFGIEPLAYDEHNYKKAHFRFTRYTAEHLNQLFVRETMKREEAVARLEREAKRLYSNTDIGRLKQQITPSYPFDWAVRQSGKYSVSQLKEHKRHAVVLENGQPDAPETALKRAWKPTPEAIVPRFLREEKPTLSGAQKGTYIHKFMELYDFTKGYNADEYSRVADCMQARRMEGMRAILPKESVAHFFETDLARQMVQASLTGQLYKEAQFVVGFPATEVMRDMDVVGMAQGAEEQLILVQGIIDAYYVNSDGNLVLMDYKTDKVKSMDELKARYETQLQYYKKTLCQLTGKRVEQMMIYSFALGEDAAI